MMMDIDGHPFCTCDDCNRARALKLEEVCSYAVELELAVIIAANLFGHHEDEMALAVLAKAARRAAGRDLAGEVEALREASKEARTAMEAASLRAAGRLN